MAKLSSERRTEVREAAKQHGYQGAADLLRITKETVRRYCRDGSKISDIHGKQDVVTNNKLLQQIKEKYSDKELRMIVNGSVSMGYNHTPIHNFGGERVKIGYLTDTHIGSIYTDDSYIDDAREEFARAGVDMVIHAGDVTEGMSNRAGHIYECSELGFDAQKDKSIELLGKFDFCPMYMIDGNHDRWYIKSNGALIVKDICEALPHAEFIGHDEGDIVVNGVTIKLWHGEDSSSYAISYRLQKLIESLSGGSKPDILVAGHVHKFGHFFIRNINCIGAGCIQKQSKWMRGKRIEAHTCFGIMEFTANDKGVGRFTNTMFPFYT